MTNIAFDLLPLVAGLLAVPLYGAAQVLALLKLHSGFRYAALLPLLLGASLLASVAEATETGAGPSTRTLLLFSPMATGYLVLLGVVAAAAAHWLARGSAVDGFAGARGSR